MVQSKLYTTGQEVRKIVNADNSLQSYCDRTERFAHWHSYIRNLSSFAVLFNLFSGS